jgi:histidinol-phosphatase (PHP family)
MLPLSTPHAHTLFTDGKNTAEEMVGAAIQKGFVSLGFSEHAKQDFDVPLFGLSEESEQEYISEIKRLQDIYKDVIALRLGMERDYYSIANRERFDYVIGSVHYLTSSARLISVDGNPDVLSEALVREWHGQGLFFVQQYYDVLGRYIADYRPDIIGHFDLVARNNAKLNMFDEESEDYLRLAYAAMDKAITGCDLLEVNTGAMARAGALLPYPKPVLLTYWRSIGGRVILSSDCHDAKMLDFGYEKGLAIIREAGYTEICYLGTGSELFSITDI